tara:strand:+ start:383 stop:784 length:402 start_codon:yes stop_codon:yes gene_type:complete
MNKTYTVIATSNIDDYKRPSSDSRALLTTFDYTQAEIVAANAWLEEYLDRFCYDGETEYSHFEPLLEIINDCPTPEEIVTYFEDNKWSIWEPEFIDDPCFYVTIQQSSTDEADVVHELNADFLDQIKAIEYTG